MRIFIICLISILCFNFIGCGIYSFTGASICADCKTVSIENFPNNAAIVAPSLSNDFTEALRNKFVSETSLTLVDDIEGDLDFKGAITKYEVTSIATIGNETSALNRLTIVVKVDYTNYKEDDTNFSQSFTAFEDFDANLSLDQVEDQLIAEINDQLITDIFNKAVVNW